MIKGLMLGAALAAAAAPAVAQTAPAQQALPAADLPVDPVRLAAALPVVDRVWPLGTFRRVMQSSMDQMTNSMLGAMFGIEASDVAKSAGDAKAAGAAGSETLGEAARRADPAFDERMRITMRVTTDEMAALMTRIEPDVRETLARVMAKRFTAAELGELGRFFATPAGTKYASESMLLATDPEMIGASMKFMPMFLEAMPAIQTKVEAATRHLPPPPKPRRTGGE